MNPLKIYSVILFMFLGSHLYSNDSLSLYLFLLDDCPICLECTPTISALHQEFGDDISFIGYFPNFSSKPEKIKEFKSKYNINFPLFSDYYKKQAKLWNASVTPEVILYNHDTEEVVYQGRIDNKFVKLGKRRNVITSHDLKNALIAALKDEKPKLSKTEPVGCYINWLDKL